MASWERGLAALGCMEGLDPTASLQDPRARAPPRLSGRSLWGKGAEGLTQSWGPELTREAPWGLDPAFLTCCPYRRRCRGASPEGRGPCHGLQCSPTTTRAQGVLCCCSWVAEVPCPLLGAGAGMGLGGLVSSFRMPALSPSPPLARGVFTLQRGLGGNDKTACPKAVTELGHENGH